MLPAVAAEVYRCSECKHRFWVGAQWKRLVLASIAVLFACGMALTVVLIIRTGTPATTQPAYQPRPRFRIRRPRPFPRGLPPLSQVPRPKDEPTATGPAVSK